ncbi:hypothetical protein KKA14_09305 [bacterium]|nr:hypothetical protein [bacterium]
MNEEIQLLVILAKAGIFLLIQGDPSSYLLRMTENQAQVISVTVPIIIAFTIIQYGNLINGN